MYVMFVLLFHMSKSTFKGKWVYDSVAQSADLHTYHKCIWLPNNSLLAIMSMLNIETDIVRIVSVFLTEKENIL